MINACQNIAACCTRNVQHHAEAEHPKLLYQKSTFVLAITPHLKVGAAAERWPWQRPVLLLERARACAETACGAPAQVLSAKAC